MIVVKAEITLYEGRNKRTIPFTSGYRPLFDNVSDDLTSGSIRLLDRPRMYPGQTAIVEIKFLQGKCPPNLSFKFYEAKEPLGEGKVLESNSN